MTDEERLEEIKRKFDLDRIRRLVNTRLISPQDLIYLVQQAEKVEYWRKQHRKRANELEDAYFKIQLIEKQLHQAQAKAERYKQALKFYADEKNHEREWDTFTDSGVEKSEVMKDGGEKARQALESDNE